MKNRVILLCVILSIFLSSCQKWTSVRGRGISSFPKNMVGIWEAQAGISLSEKWRIKFEEDGSISKIYHNMFGPVIVKEGGGSRNGPHPGTYLTYVLGPIEVEYNSISKMINMKIVVDNFEAMFTENNKLEGRMVDLFSGSVSKDGQIWEVEWCNYGWLKGATEPDIEDALKNPEKIVFRKIDPNSMDSITGINN